MERAEFEAKLNKREELEANIRRHRVNIAKAVGAIPLDEPPTKKAPQAPAAAAIRNKRKSSSTIPNVITSRL